jgi:hypothetical protein
MALVPFRAHGYISLIVNEDAAHDLADLGKLGVIQFSVSEIWSFKNCKNILERVDNSLMNALFP